MKSSEGIASLAAALVKAHLEIKPIQLDKSVSYKGIKFEYASISNIIQSLRPILANNGLALIQIPSLFWEDSRRFVRVSTTLVHTTGEFIEGDIAMDAESADPKQIGSIITYARRYALGAMLSIALDGDYDAATIGEPYTATQDQKVWLRDTLIPMGITAKEALAKISEQMIKNGAEATRECVIDAMELIKL